MKKRIDKIDVSAVAPIVLLALFAVLILMVLVSGARIYKDFTEKDAKSNAQRTAEQYVSARIRQSDSSGGAFIGDFSEPTEKDSGDTLYIREVYDGVEYYTRIYCYDGYLCELFSSSEFTASESDGERIIGLSELNFTVNNGLLSVKLTFPDGEKSVLFYNLH